MWVVVVRGGGGLNRVLLLSLPRLVCSRGLDGDEQKLVTRHDHDLSCKRSQPEKNEVVRCFCAAHQASAHRHYANQQATVLGCSRRR